MYIEGFSWFTLIVTIAAAAAAFLLWFLLTNNNSPSPSPSVSAIASPSPSPPPSAPASDTLLLGEYEVFLSFHGEDTRKGFTDFLYTYLDGAGIRTFRDNEGLHVGEEIGPELLKAIKGSKISIPIFSKHYAYGKWCLLELAQMVECHENGGQVIFPIFYDVDPYSVRHQSGCYEEAFCQHSKKSFDEKTVQGWKDALAKVGQLKGLELKKETDGHEGKLVKKVVEMVLSKLKKNYTHVSDNLVGMDEHIKEMEGLLNVGSDGVRIVGIYGMGGLGKTTIAKVIYNHLCERFECCCFLDDVRENSQQHNGIVKLQMKLLSKLIQNKKISDIADVSEGIDRIKNAIHGKKVFIVLDDIEEKSQFDSLAGSSDWFASGSRIIVTTRNKKVLVSLEAVNLQKGLLDVFGSYEPPVTNPDISLQLFCKYAFMRDSPNEGYDSLAKDVVSVAARLPLVLVTLGSLLFGEKEKALWEEKVRELQDIPDKEVQRKFKISFEALTPMEKEIFLDIACLFIGRDKTYPCYMWDDLGFYSRNVLNVLVQRSLIKVGDDNTFKMHDQLRDLGRYINREGIVDEWGRCSRLWNKDKALEVYRSYQGTENVKALCLGPFEFRKQNLSGRKIGRLPNLWYLTMDGAFVDGNFEHCLQNLRWLQWRQCVGIPAPTNFHLRNLVILDLSKGDNTLTEDSKLWIQFKMSEKLKVLHLYYCTYLRRVPYLSTFSNLERLVLRDCALLSSLDGIEELESLRYLYARRCYSLTSWPNLSRLRKLEELDVSECHQTEIVGLDKLESLERLYKYECLSLQRLLDLSNLKRLKALDVSRCYNLIEIQGLERLGSLELLYTRDCRKLERFPDLSNLKRLKELDTSDMLSLSEIRGLGGLESLKVLNMSHCDRIERIFDLSNLKRLRKLSIRSRNLIEIPALEGLESLEHLVIRDCESIERLPDLSNLKSLKILDVSSCRALIKIEGLHRLKSLKHLNIGYCESIEDLPDFSNLKQLEVINASWCEKLTEIRGLDKLESLRAVFISGCKSLKNLPYLQDSRIHDEYYPDDGISQLYVSFNVFYIQVISSTLISNYLLFF